MLKNRNTGVLHMNKVFNRVCLRKCVIKSFFTLFILLSAVGAARAEGFDLKPLSLIPIQEGGRVKPMDTFARYCVRLITGQEMFEGRTALDILLDMVTHSKDWEKKKCVLVENLDLRNLLGMEKGEKYADYNGLVHNESFLSYAKSNILKQRQKLSLNPMEKESLAVLGRLQKFEDIQTGDALTVIPIAHPKTQKWASLGDLKRALDRDQAGMPDAARDILLCFAGIMKSYDAKNFPDFLAQTQDLGRMLRQIGGKDYPAPSDMGREVHYNSLEPFRLAWILHLTAFLLLGLSLLMGVRTYSLGYAAFLAGLLISGYGFTLRCLIAGRPPVSNMYESLIWVTFGMTVFALVFERIYKNPQFIICGSALAVVGFVLADNVPAVLDPSIQPIEPVLRSNFWLTIHVLTITLSYAAFLLSLGIGHLGLWTLWKKHQDRELLQRQARLLYRIVQVGVVFLAVGTILGGVWANYAWGRFWGWDPKETWALIALLGYVAILHGRLSGWLREAGFIIGVVAAFLGVLMAWYGVNFVLGVGLHSYGFSKGGLPYVTSFVALELILLILVGLKVRKAATV